MEANTTTITDKKTDLASKDHLSHVPKQVRDAILRKTKVKLEGPTVRGYDFNNGINYDEILKSYATTGLMATNLSKGIEIINNMLKWRLIDEPFKEETEDESFRDPEVRKNIKCTIFLGYTSNLISSGLRDILKFLVQHKLVDCIVTTAGGVEEDFIKCFAPTYLGDFHLDDRHLRKSGVNRTANLLVPNTNYVRFEEWIMPLYDEMHTEQVKKGTIWTPSKVIRRLGERINNEDSVYYWAAKNKIPVFCPALTDGSLGDMLFFHSYNKKHFKIDLVKDIRKLDKKVLRARKTGVVILGGGLVKHHILNANLMRNGADFAVFVNTGNEWDGSDAGARPSEALSWGKLRLDSENVKIWADATLVFPIIVAQSFAKYHQEQVRLKEMIKQEENKEIIKQGEKKDITELEENKERKD